MTYHNGAITASVISWTLAAAECYARGCICWDCNYRGYIEHPKGCKMKYSVMNLVDRFGAPPEHLIENAKRLINEEKRVKNYYAAAVMHRTN